MHAWVRLGGAGAKRSRSGFNGAEGAGRSPRGARSVSSAMAPPSVPHPRRELDVPHATVLHENWLEKIKC